MTHLSTLQADIQKIIVSNDIDGTGQYFLHDGFLREMSEYVQRKEEEATQTGAKAQTVSEAFAERQPDQAPICDDCGDQMVVRTRRADGEKFYGCPNYPECTNTAPY